MAKKKTNKTIVKGPVNGNIFAVVAACTRALKKDGKTTEAKELMEKVHASKSYDDALCVCMSYVEFDL